MRFIPEARPIGENATFSDNIAGIGSSGFGGAIYSETSSHHASTVTIGNHATFSGNIAGYTNNGQGGAISSLTSPSSLSALVKLGSHTSFVGNRAGGNNAYGEGGAIAVGGRSSALLEISSHTLFDGNLASGSGSYSYGGAIFFTTHAGGLLTLDTGTGADAGAIAFRNNKANVNTTDPQNPSGGDANSIHMTGNTQLALIGSENIYFDDPISCGTSPMWDGNNSLTKDGDGFVQFVGDNVLNAAGFTGGSVSITGGTFRVVEGASFTTQGEDAAFDVTGTLAGGGMIAAENGFTISGAVSPDSDRFEIPDWIGTVNGVNVNTFAPSRTTLAADKTIGELTLDGDVEFTNATLNIDVTSTANDKIVVQNGVVSGSSNTVNISATGLAKGDTEIWFLDGTGAESLYSNTTITSMGSRYRYSLISETDALGVIITANGFTDLYNDRLSPNGNRLVSLIDKLPNGHDFLTALDSLTDDAAVISGIENATGESYAMAMHGEVRLQQVFNDFILARKTYYRDDQHRVVLGQSARFGLTDNEIWGRFTGGSHDRSNIGRYSGYDLNSYGVAFGLEHKIGSRWFGGVAFGYDNARMELDDRFAKNSFEAFRTSLYGGYAGTRSYFSGYAGYAKNWHDVTRNNPALGFTNHGKYDDDIFSTGFELGMVRQLWENAQLIPSFGVHWVHLESPEFTESGSEVSALRLSKSRYNSVRVPIGARLNKTFAVRSISLTPEVRAFYVAELADSQSGVYTAFASSFGSGTAFADSGNGGHSGGMFGTGVMAQITDRLSMGLDYDCEVWENYDRHNLIGNVTYRW